MNLGIFLRSHKLQVPVVTFCMFRALTNFSDSRSFFLFFRGKISGIVESDLCADLQSKQTSDWNSFLCIYPFSRKRHFIAAAGIVAEFSRKKLLTLLSRFVYMEINFSLVYMSANKDLLSDYGGACSHLLRTGSVRYILVVKAFLISTFYFFKICIYKAVFRDLSRLKNDAYLCLLSTNSCIYALSIPRHSINNNTNDNLDRHKK